MLLYFATATAVAAVDLNQLWDYSNPALSEQRFRSALESARGDDVLILRAQIARTYMLRKEFEAARTQLLELEPAVRAAGPEAQARYWLEMGRSYASHRHSPESQTPQAKQRARAAFEKALEISKRAKLDAVTVDVLHMFVFVDTAPADQLRWNQQALSVIEASSDADARRWEASIRSNTGEALFDLGRYDDALTQFRKSLALREQGTNAAATRDAHWQIARILRLQNHIDEALAIQLRIEREAQAAQQARVYIFEELELLYRAKGQLDRAEDYARRVKTFASEPVTVDIQGSADWKRSAYMRAYYDATVATFAKGTDIDVGAYEARSFEIFREFARATGRNEQGMVDHLELIPRQVVEIVKADPSVLKDYDAFWAALAGPD